MAYRNPLSNLVYYNNSVLYGAKNNLFMINAMNEWFFGTSTDPTSWPHFNPVTGAAPTLRYVPSEYASISDAATASNYSDIIVVDAGTYTEDVDLPQGVTLRSNGCVTVVLDGRLTCRGLNTIRHITIRHQEDDLFLVDGSDIWFEDCTIENTSVAPNESYTFDIGGSSIIFRRCRLTCTVQMLMSIATIEYFEMSSCIINMDGGIFPSVEVGPYNGTLSNNLVVVVNAATDFPIFSFDPYTSDYPCMGNVYICDVYTGAYVTTNNAVGNNNYYLNVDSGAFSDDLADFTLGQLDMTDGYGLRNASVIRQVADFAGPVLDINRHPFETIRSAGPTQWQPEASALYRPRFDQDLVSATAFNFVYNRLGLELANTVTTDERTYYSHDEIACHVNMVVGDICHPSRGYFYCSHDGYYRLVVLDASFDLTLSANAATVFGAYSETAQVDTGE